MEHKLWYTKWTEKYVEGLPVGNGRLAAMALGRPEKLRVALNHEWMWRGENRFREVEDMSAHLPEVREALLEGNYFKGTSLANQYFGGGGGMKPSLYEAKDITKDPYMKFEDDPLTLNGRVDPYQPVGDLWIELDAGNAENYTRSLDLDTGLFKTEFQAPCGQVIQQVFASCVDECLVVDVATEKACDMKVSLTRKEDWRCTITYEKRANGLLMKGSFMDGISFEAAIRLATDGFWEAEGDSLKISAASYVLVLIQIGTDAKGVAPQTEMVFPEEVCFNTLYLRHEKTFRTLKGTAVLDIDVKAYDLPTDERIMMFREGKDSGIPLLYFEFGRYLMVSGSSGELPLNLQGKWNEDLQPSWECDYHMDINLEMCYWFVETLGMKHAANGLFNLIERYVPYGKVVAQKLYGCRGVTMAIQTDVWGRVTPESCGWAVWLGAAPWLGQHMFMHWRYTKDIVFLKERCYPYLKEVAAFYEDYLVEIGDELWILPSQSPENSFKGTGEWPVSICINSAMDRELVVELMNSVAECADVLGVDADKAVLWRDIAARIPKFTVDSIGRLNEWDMEREEKEPGHRHMSHLYGVYPSQLFEPGSMEWNAAEKSLDVRLSYDGGNTGWSRSWVACLMARFGRAEEAWEQFMALIRDFTTVTLLDLINLDPPIQIDGNMGGTAYVCEMLMQSRRGKLFLLPALPAAWKKGYVQNFRAQDGVNVSFAWEEGKLASYELTAQENQRLIVVSGGEEWNVELEAGKVYRFCRWEGQI